jgi:acetyltransferase-like isoleucine patch superfamily enzyme
LASSHGTGEFSPEQFARLGERVVFEAHVLVFHPENIEIDDDVYVGHQTILKGYHKNRMVIGAGSWIGQQCFFHSAGGLTIGRRVGIGPGVRILTSSHSLQSHAPIILDCPLEFRPVTIEDGADIGVSAVILPGVTIGQGAQIGAGAVVSQDIPPFAIAAGVPARVVRQRL